MIGLLLISVFALLLLYSFIQNRNMDFGEPGFLLLAATFLSAFFVVLNYENWNVASFSIRTVILILNSLIAFCLGSILAKTLYNFLPKRIAKVTREKSVLSVKNSVFWTTIGFTIFATGYYFWDLLRNSGLSLSYFALYMAAIRPMLKSNEISIGFFAIQLFSISRVLAYIYVYMFLRNLIEFHKKDFKYLAVPAIYLIMSLLTSGRIYLIYFLIYTVVLYFILSKKNRTYSLGEVVRLIVKVFFIICSGLVIFGLLANLVGRNTSHTIFEQLSIYVGGPLVSFDKYIKLFTFQKPRIFGEETLTGLYQIGNKLGLTNLAINRHLEYIQFGQNWGNVYTAMRRYLHDYGTNMSYLIMAGEGFFYGMFYKITSVKASSNKYNILYAMLIYPVPMMIVDDVLLSSLVSINTIYDLVYFLILFSMIIQKQSTYKIIGDR